MPAAACSDLFGTPPAGAAEPASPAYSYSFTYSYSYTATSSKTSNASWSTFIAACPQSVYEYVYRFAE
ncbi:hypothetical protein L6Q96_01150, partial [Candidatus Binatia bacterium]|nr:hypothetical protein [Candidatus Binatia bacterium]